MRNSSPVFNPQYFSGNCQRATRPKEKTDKFTGQALSYHYTGEHIKIEESSKPGSVCLIGKGKPKHESNSPSRKFFWHQASQAPLLSVGHVLHLHPIWNSISMTLSIQGLPLHFNPLPVCFDILGDMSA